VVAALWVERYLKREQGQIWVRLPLVLMLATATSALLYWIAQFRMIEAAGREPMLWVGVAVSITTVIVVFAFRSSRRRWLALALITTGVAFAPTVRALLNENFKIEEYAAPIGETPTPSVVVLILVDTLRADALSYSNRAASKTSNIDALAADSVDFRNAISPAPWTLPAMNALMSGIAPLWQPKDFRFLAPALRTWLSILRNSAIPTERLLGTYCCFARNT